MKKSATYYWHERFGREARVKFAFITHYFPPLNSAGARRVDAFAKYLAARGHEITVITTRKTERDGLLSEAVPPYVHLIEIDNFGRFKPTVATATDVGKFGVKTRSLTGGILLRFRRAVMKWSGQLLDHRLLFALQFANPWISPEVRAALQGTDAIVSSCPPWITHLAGRFAKVRYGKPWVADYRDQFSGSHILRGSFVSRPLEVWLERWLIKPADRVVAISGPMQEYYAQFHSNVACIENGYDAAVFDQAVDNLQGQEHATSSGDMVLRYMGAISEDRIPVAFFQALAEINQKPGRRMIAEFYGESTLLRKALPGMVPDAKPYVRFCPQLPYAEAIRAMLTADALFFIETSDFSSHSARGVLTTKLFEYLAARKPLVAEIDAHALAASYIVRSGLGLVISKNRAEICRGLEVLREGRFKPVINDAFVTSLSRQVKTGEVEQLLTDLVTAQRAMPQ